MEFVIKISQFLLSLSLLIVLHELGHFIPAKAFKTRVEKFYLFFDIKYSLFKKKIGETVYGIGWLPLGGYVKISGMIDESMDKEQMAQPPQPWEFRSKPSWQRLIIMLGGVTVNFILAYFIYALASFTYGDVDIDAKSIADGYYVSNPILTDLGIETGDNLLAVNGEEVTTVFGIRKSIIKAEVLTIKAADGTVKEVALPEDFLGQMSTAKNKTFFELRYPFVVDSIASVSPNKDADLEFGDILVGFNGEQLKYFDEAGARLKPLANQTIDVEVLKNDGSRTTIKLDVDNDGKLGIYPTGTLNDIERVGYYDIIRKEYSFGESWVVGLDKFKLISGTL